MITRNYLRRNPNHIFVFGDNLKRSGKGGAAHLRDELNTYGFITKKYPSNDDSSFYHVNEYKKVYKDEIDKLKKVIKFDSGRLYLISKIGSGLANKYNIFEEVIEKNMKKDLEELDNVKFLW